MRKTSSYIICASCIFFCITAKAQSFKNKASVEPVAKTGFYSITISSRLSSYVKTDFRDLRILDDKENPVPYVIKSGLPLIKPAEFILLNILSNQLTDSGKSIIVIENNNGQKISDFFLKIKNASVGRTIDLSGSDDNKHWFSITENVSLQKKFITDDDNYLENISFPLSSYHYLRLIIYNGKNDPLNIISVGKYSGEEIKSSVPFIENPACRISQKDSNDHISYITVHNPQLYHISHISLYIKGPKYFKRNINIIAPDIESDGFTISSDSVFQFDFPVFKDSIWQIKIYNGDNPSLLVQKIETAQELKKAIAYLEANKQYKLEMNSDSAQLPHYELVDFKDSISLQVPELKILKIEPLINTPIAPASIFKQWWVWPVIIFVLLILVLFTFRLSKEVGKK